MIIYISALSETATIGDTEFSELQAACRDDGDEMINHYYQQCLFSANLSREDLEIPEDEMGNRDYHGIGFYANKAMVGAIGEGQQDWQSDAKLSESYNFILESDPILSPSYLSMSALKDSILADGSVFSLSYALSSLSLLVDMLWYYENGDYREELAAKLDSIAYFAKEIVDNTEFGAYDYYVYGDPDETEIIDIVRFSPGYDNRRLLLLGALGYAGCVLENREYINRVDWELLERGMTDTDIVGLLDHLTQDSGIYAEGLAYRSFSLQGLTNYFTARNRLNNLEILENLDHGVFNYYNEVHIRKMFEESFFLLCPDLTFTTFEDCRKLNIKRSDGLNPQNIKNNNYFPFGMFEYYYQQTDQTATELLSHIEFYLNESYSNHDSYPTLLFSSYIRPLLYSYSANGNLLHEDPVIPARFQEPNYSNEEFTVLRDGLEDVTDFRENLAIWVNHENYESYKILHEHGDQTSFTMYYKGRNLTLS